MKSHKSRFLLSVIALVFLPLTACDKQKPVLTGQRETFVALETRLQPDVSLAHQTVNITPAMINDNWPQVRGNASHSLGPLQLSNDPKLQWQISLGRGVSNYQRLLSMVVIEGQRIYGMDADGLISAIEVHNNSPKVVWQQSTIPHSYSEPLGGGLAVEAGIVYATTSFGEVLALEGKDGQVLWRSSVHAPIRTAPTVKDGRVFVVTISNETFAFEAKTGAQLWSHAGIAEQAALLGGASPTIADNVIITAYSSGEVYALQPENGQVLWSDTLTSAVRIDTVSSIPHIRACPVIDKGQVFVVSHGGRMTAIDLKTGVRQWQRTIGGIHAPTLAGNWLFMLSIQGEVFCLNRETGAVRWVAALPKLAADGDKQPIFWSGPVIANDQLVFSGSHGQVYFISIKDGKHTKSLSFSGQSFLEPVIASQTLYVLNDQAELYAWR